MKVVMKPTLDSTPDVKDMMITKGDVSGDVVIVLTLTTGAMCRIVMSADEALHIRNGIESVVRPTFYVKLKD